MLSDAIESERGGIERLTIASHIGGHQAGISPAAVVGADRLSRNEPFGVGGKGRARLACPVVIGPYDASRLSAFSSEVDVALATRGASKVYAAARDPASVSVQGVEVLPLDLLDQASIEAVAQVAGDVTLLVNNAGISTGQNLIRGDRVEVRREMETNFFGALAVTRAFADVLAANGGGAIINVLSALSFVSWDGVTSYCASKAAEWSLTAGTRVELTPQGTHVLGLHLGGADTDRLAGFDGPLLDPTDVVRTALDGLEAGQAPGQETPWISWGRAEPRVSTPIGMPNDRPRFAVPDLEAISLIPTE